MKRDARNATIVALVTLTVSALLWLDWWNAQVHHKQGPRRGFAEGDPFPWFFIYPAIALGLWFVLVAIRKWSRYVRTRRPHR